MNKFDENDGITCGMTGTVAARRGTLELLAAARVRAGTRAGNGQDLGKNSNQTNHPPKEYSEAACRLHRTSPKTSIPR